MAVKKEKLPTKYGEINTDISRNYWMFRYNCQNMGHFARLYEEKTERVHAIHSGKKGLARDYEDRNKTRGEQRRRRDRVKR